MGMATHHNVLEKKMVQKQDGVATGGTKSHWWMEGRRATEVRQELLLTDQSPCVDGLSCLSLSLASPKLVLE
jgi:hypothetical protein